MENLLRDKDIWILGSVCLVATFLWRKWWKLFSIKKRRKTASPADLQVLQLLFSAVMLRIMAEADMLQACMNRK